MKKLTIERYLHLKGYTTEITSRQRIKANKGAPKALIEMLFIPVVKGDLLYFANLINEVQGLLKEYSLEEQYENK